MAGKDPDYLTRRLYDEINSSKKPTWNVYAQIIDPEKQGVNIFDATKVIPDEQCTVVKFGKITLTEPPQNFFTQVEQAAFNPANVVPGWDVSPDPRMLYVLLHCSSPSLTAQCSKSGYSCMGTPKDTAWASTTTSFPSIGPAQKYGRPQDGTGHIICGITQTRGIMSGVTRARPRIITIRAT